MKKSLFLGLSVTILSASGFSAWAEMPVVKPFHVAIDPGHGGIDNGLQGTSLAEKELTLQLALELKARLEQEHIQVTLTREQDQEIMLKDRVLTAQAAKVDCLISLHFDKLATSKQPFQLYYPQDTSKNLALLIQNNLSKAGNWETQLALPQLKDLYVLRESKVPAVMVSASIDAIQDKRSQTQLVQGISQAVLSYSTQGK
jgi:N-acetylmuramoyl-L-alanine amidase